MQFRQAFHVRQHITVTKRSKWFHYKTAYMRVRTAFPVHEDTRFGKPEVLSADHADDVRIRHHVLGCLHTCTRMKEFCSSVSIQHICNLRSLR